MIDKFYKPKKRVNSLIDDYERNKKLLPFIKPRYIHEEMFQRNASIGNKMTGRTKSTPKHSEPTLNRKCETQASDEVFHKKQNSDISDLNRIRYRLKDFYKFMIKGKIELQKIDKKSDVSSQQEYSDPSKIHFSFIRRRVKKRNLKSEKKEEVYLTLDETIYKEKLLYTPVLLKPQFTNNIQQISTSPRKQCKNMGRIKRQSIKDNRMNRKEQEYKETIDSIRKEKLKKNFKKIGNVILFIAFLKRYNKKYQSRRKRYLQKSSNNIQSLLVQLKLYFSDRFSNLYQALCRKHQQIYHILQSDSQQVKIQKLSSIKCFMGILIDCISRSIDNLKGRTNFIELIYALCKHGSFSCQYTFHTPQELDISCISPDIGYIRGDNFLQKSYIIGFVFIKMIIFNILLKPQLINFSLNPLFDKSRLFLAIKLIANIFYQIMIDMQDNLLELADDKFKIGNWRGLTSKFDIRVSESMTVKKGFYQKNELISGLIGHSFIKQTYKIDEMKDQMKLVEQIVLKVHLLLKEYHIRVSKNCM